MKTKKGTAVMDAQKLTLYVPSWQALRVSLLGQWNTINRVKANCDTLSLYIAGATNVNERRSRLWRVTNLLNAVKMGYSGQNLLDSEMYLWVLSASRHCSTLHKAAGETQAKYVIPTEQEIKDGWEALSIKTRQLILTNLTHRLDLHKESPHRPELRWFLEIVSDIK